jgi:hypothetical protein
MFLFQSSERFSNFLHALTAAPFALAAMLIVLHAAASFA